MKCSALYIDGMLILGESNMSEEKLLMLQTQMMLLINCSFNVEAP